MTAVDLAAAPPLARPHAWDLVATDYTRDLAPHCARFARDALAYLALPAGAPVIDVAAGPGTLALLAAQRGLAVTAVDFSPDMIALLAARARDQGLRVAASVGDGHALAFPDAAFAAAFSIFGLMFFADRARGAAELRRVVAPGGSVVVGSWAPLDEVPALAALFAALRRAAPEIAMPPVPAQLGRPDEVRDLLIAAGLGDVRVHTVAHALSYASPAELWSSFALSAAPVALVRERVGEPRFIEISAAAIAELSATLGPGPVDAPMPAHLGIGVR